MFHLFPIKYQIKSDEDIIDLIKYDILLEILKKDENIFKPNRIDDINQLTLVFYTWFKNKYKPNNFLQDFITVTDIFGKLGKSVTAFLRLDEEFQKFKDNYLEGDGGIVKKFIEEQRKNDVGESDYLSNLINIKVKELKKSKKSILILDDMDRIDPDHIFRILNLLSSFGIHDNKFDFDSIIIVGDKINIKSIFKHKYGETSDFEGYFDKFFTVKPFYLDNKKIVAERIPDLIEYIKHGDLELSSAIKRGGTLKFLLADILIRSLNINKLNLRQLYKPIDYGFSELKQGVYLPNSRKYGLHQIIDIAISLLVAVYGGEKKVFVDILKEIKGEIYDTGAERSYFYDRYLNILLRFVENIQPGQQIERSKEFIITRVDGPSYQYKIEGKEYHSIKLFYDLLIEYVEKSHQFENVFKYSDEY